METENSAKTVVQAFFHAFGSGDYEGILDCFHPNCVLVAVRSGERSGTQLYGTYAGSEGVKSFLANLSATFDTKAFNVENIVSENAIVFANGTFTHQVKATGKMFSSRWSLMCVIQDQKILEYHFYEDSAAYSEAAN